MDVRTTEAVRQIFQDCQTSISKHRKNAAALWKYQQRLSKDTAGERAFNEEFLRNLNLALPIKKGAGVADRVIRFVAQYVKFAAEKDGDSADKKDGDSDDGESLTSRFVHRLLTHLMRGLKAKDKNVRMRVCQLIAESIGAIQDIDLDLYNKLKLQLFQRLREKDPAVRVQAVKAISGLQTSEGLEDEEGRPVEEVLLEMMQHDPSAEVRRVVMENLGATNSSRPYLMERARDIDVNVRKSFYSKVLFGDEITMDHLSLDERERVLVQGLMDREAAVQKACGKLLSERWIKQSGNNLVSFLAQFDVVSNPSVAEHAIKAFLRSSPNFTPPNDESIWDDLLPEVALILAVYCEQQAAGGKQDAIDELIPEVSAHVSRIEKYFQLSVGTGDSSTAMTEDDIELSKVGYDFVLTQLLRIALLLDYSDEVGRRNMFAALRTMLGSNLLDEMHLPTVVEVMRKTAFDERDFARIVVETITDLISDSEPPSASQDAAEDGDMGDAERYILKMEAINRGLEIIRCVLEKLDGDLSSLPSLVGLLNELVIPATRIGDESILSIQYRSLHCLALFCLLDQGLAVEYMPMFRETFGSSEDSDVRTLCLRTMCDLIALHGASGMGRGVAGDALKPLLSAVEGASSEAVHTTAVHGVAKLILAGQINDERTLHFLASLFFHPATANNAKLRQCLSAFFEIYPQSSPRAKSSLAKIVTTLWMELLSIYKRLDKQSQGTMTSPLLIGQQLLDWIDVRKLQPGAEDVQPNLHLEVALELVHKLLSTRSASIRKVTCQVLAKMDLETAGSLKTLKKLLAAVERLKQLTNDTTALNALKKLSAALLKLDSDEPILSEADMKDITEFRSEIQNLYGLEIEGDDEAPVQPKGRPRKSKAAAAESADEEPRPKAVRSRPSRARKSKPVASDSDVEEDSDDAQDSSDEDSDQSTGED
ncbi:nuclear condensing complex subunit [Hyaloraphidium curvatum]|nr:nuclear condensing complex subunit [Hyaloraphidium curvatum]